MGCAFEPVWVHGKQVEEIGRVNSHVAMVGDCKARAASDALHLRESCGCWEECVSQTRELPSVESFICVVRKFRERQTPLACARQLHLHACNSGVDVQRVLGNHFVQMFMQCKSISDTQQVFNKLPYCNEYSWIFLIQGFIECGELEQAFDLFPKIHEIYVQDNKSALMAVLKACSKLGYVDSARGVHAEIVKEAYEKDAFFGSALVNMYSKYGLLAEARGVFDEIADGDIVLWNSLIAGYSEHGLAEETLECLKEMQLQALSPSRVTVVYSLKACIIAGSIEKGRELCAEIFKEGYESDPFVGSALLDMFAKCSSIAEAQNLFDEMPVQDVILWNTLITGYVDHGLFEEALICYGQMQLEGLLGNAVTFACSLKACGNKGAINKGQEIHMEIVKEGYHVDQVIGNALVDMYVKCGFFEEAHEVFFELPLRDVFSWTALIAGYAEHGCREKALSCLEWMQLDSVSPNCASFVCILKACGGMIGAIDRGHELHLEIIKKGYENDSFVGNALVDMYGKCGLLTDAQEVCEKLPVQDVISWTALITRYAEHGLSEEALETLKLMQRRGISPNAVTYLCSLKACASLGAVDRGQEIHMEIIKHGFERAHFAGNTLVDMYAKCGFLAEAQEIFDKLPFQSDVSWNTLALGYAECGSSEEVLTCFQNMQSEGLSPNVVTFLCSLKACGNLGAIDNGREVHSMIEKEGGYLVCSALVDLHANGAPLALTSALIDMYCKCGSMSDAQQVFNAMGTRETGTFNSLMTGYACRGESALVFHLLDKMREEGRQPDEVTFLSVLSVCSHAGLPKKGREYFDAMRSEFDVFPTVKHHTCMVDLLGRAGQLDEAMAVVASMPSQPDFVVWSSVLGACHKWGNAELASQAFECAVKLDVEKAAMFVLLSNIIDAQISTA